MGDRLSIQAELMDVSDGSQFWGDQCRRKFSDIFTIEEEISREISAQLRLKLSGEEKKRLAKRHTGNTEAYELYLKGRYHWSKRTADGLKKAIEYFEQATASDPDYALAYAGLSDCYNLASAYGMIAPKESVPRAHQATQHALDLDPLLPEGHEALAHAKMLYDWDWAGAETSFSRAIELNPNYATAHQRYAIFLAALGRLKQAEAEIARARVTY
jgi:tetratricopeptide (TPR) repeat protein